MKLSGPASDSFDPEKDIKLRWCDTASGERMG